MIYVRAKIFERYPFEKRFQAKEYEMKNQNKSKTKPMRNIIIIFTMTLLTTLSKVNGQSQVKCYNLHLDTTVFYISPQTDTVVSGNLFYNDTTATVYPSIRLILSDTSIITSPEVMFLSFLQYGNVQPLFFRIKFKTLTFSNNSIVNGLVHIYDTDSPGDSIVSCYYPVTLILQNPTGINEIGNKSDLFKIFPNPTNHSATLVFNNPQNENCMLSLFDIHGRLVQTMVEILNDRVEIKRNMLLNGIYFFQIRNSQKLIANGKLIFE